MRAERLDMDVETGGGRSRDTFARDGMHNPGRFRDYARNDRKPTPTAPHTAIIPSHRGWSTAGIFPAHGVHNPGCHSARSEAQSQNLHGAAVPNEIPRLRVGERAGDTRQASN